MTHVNIADYTDYSFKSLWATYWHRWTSCTPRRFTHDITCTSPPPPPPANIYIHSTEAVERERERRSLKQGFYKHDTLICTRIKIQMLTQREEERQKERGRTFEKTTL